MLKIIKYQKQQYRNKLRKNKIKQFLTNTMYHRLSSPFSNDIITQNHILPQDVLIME